MKVVNVKAVMEKFGGRLVVVWPCADRIKVWRII